MQVKNKQTGDVETMRHGPARDAVTAGTHEFVNVDATKVVEDASVGQATAVNGGAASGGVDLDAMTKDELLAEAKKRGVDVKPADSKAEILAALKV